MRNKTACFTAQHKKDKKDIDTSLLKEKIHETVKKLVKDEQVKIFISRLEAPLDYWFSKMVIAQKEMSEDILLKCIISNKCLDKTRTEEDQTDYEEINDKCDEIDFEKNEKREKYLADKSDMVLVVWDGDEKSETGKTIEYAKEQFKKVIIIDTRDFSVSAIPKENATADKHPRTRVEDVIRKLFKRR